MLLYKNVVLIRCYKWLSFQSAEYNHHRWDSYDKNHLAQRGYFRLSLSPNDNDSTFQCIWKYIGMIIIRAMLSGSQ